MGMLTQLNRLGALLRLRQVPPGVRVNWPATSFQAGWPLMGSARGYEMTYSAVFTAIDRISSDVGKIPLRHWRRKPDGGREEVLGSQPISVWRKPNDLQTQFDIIKLIVASQLYRGNAYVLCRVNGRNQVTEMHVLSPDRCTPYVVQETGDVFYRVARDPLAQVQFDEMVPARYIMHHRVQTLINPLFGITPLVAAAASVMQGQQIQNHGAAFFANMARPSGFLTTENKLDRQKAAEIAQRWQETFGGAPNAGKTPVLEQGLKYQQLTMTATDSQLIEQLRWTVEDIARVFQIPAFLIGDMSRVMQAAFESLMRIYYSSCLMAHFVALAQRINDFFELDHEQEYLEFDVDELFRTDLDTRTTAWKNAVQGGLATPNEGRAAAFGFNPVEGGDQVFMQQQMIPITMLGHVSMPGGSQPPPSPGSAKPPGEQGPASADEPAPAAEDVKAALRDELQRRMTRWAA